MMLWELFVGFLKVGCFAFSGAYGAIPLIRDVVMSYGWLTEAELTWMIAVSESTPGPLAVNISTYVGRVTAGLPGAACATLGVVLPSFLLIAALSSALQAFRQERVVAYALFGIRAGVLALILKALWSLFRKCRRDWFSLAVMALAFVASAILDISAIAVILCCAALGIAAHSLGREKP